MANRGSRSKSRIVFINSMSLCSRKRLRMPSEIRKRKKDPLPHLRLPQKNGRLQDLNSGGESLDPDSICIILVCSRSHPQSPWRSRRNLRHLAGNGCVSENLRLGSVIVDRSWRLVNEKVLYNAINSTAFKIDCFRAGYSGATREASISP